jgi:peptidoglycan/xylan/chitin deacetylase (PgdA/CDA1 family)
MLYIYFDYWSSRFSVFSFRGSLWEIHGFSYSKQPERLNSNSRTTSNQVTGGNGMVPWNHATASHAFPPIDPLTRSRIPPASKRKHSMGKRDLLANLLDRSRLNRLPTRRVSTPNVVVFNYHRIGRPDGTLFDRDLFSATEEQFADQVRFLSRNCDIISPADLNDLSNRPRGRHAIITFDDGYIDNYEAAFPILTAYGATATFFITTGFLDSRPAAWWDEIAWIVRRSPHRQLAASRWTNAPLEFDEPHRQSAIARLLTIYKSLPGHQTEEFINFLAAACGSGRCPESEADALWMTWDMVREMHAAGMTIGGHTVNHPVLANLPAREQYGEIAGCKRRIEQRLGRPINTFSYPVGQPRSFNDATRKCLQRAGFDMAFSYYGGTMKFPPSDRFDLPRVAVEQHTTPHLFRCTATLPTVFA